MSFPSIKYDTTFKRQVLVFLQLVTSKTKGENGPDELFHTPDMAQNANL